MSRVIFGAWDKILGKSVTGKRVQIEWLLDADKKNAAYLEVSIVDGQSTYSLAERSLGFRWFFSFLLFTEFRRNRKSDGSTIFIFDEPAANLHSRAQIKLLESFSRIASGSTYVVYSTHSHYMINPLWLERAYIIENKATDYAMEDDVTSFSVRKTDIKAIRYRQFVGSHPTKTTYFQPVLDALNVPFSPLVRSSHALIVEGKYDYHPFVYLRSSIGASAQPELFPANGAGDMGNLINLFRGWGVNFRIILDDDSAGRQAKKRYFSDYLLLDHEVKTIGDINPALKGKPFEGVYQHDVKEAINAYYNVENPTKRQQALFFQEMLLRSSTDTYPVTLAMFAPISEWLDAEFS